MIEKAKRLETLFKEIQKEAKKRDKLSDKAFGMNHHNSTLRQMEKSRGNLIESNRHIERLKLLIAREFKDSQFDIETDERISNTSGFHEYKL